MTISDFGKLLWAWVEKGETIFSLFAMLFAGMATVQLWLQRRRQGKFIKSVCHVSGFTATSKALEGVQTENPRALAISVSSRTPSIRNDVETFLNMKKWQMKIATIELPDIGKGGEGGDSVADVDFFLKALLEKRVAFDMDGVTELHLFVQAPVCLPIYIGAIFDHWKPVKIYQKRLDPAPPLYEYWGLLTKY